MSVLTDLRRPIHERLTVAIHRADNDRALYTYEFYVAIDREFAKRVVGILDHADIEYGARTYAVIRSDRGTVINPPGGHWHATTREARRYRKAN
jgi:hypothetical protein